MSTYTLPAVAPHPAVAPRTAYLIASGDLRESANTAGWPTQVELEAGVTRVLGDLGWSVVRANDVDPRTGHGFISSQRMGLEVFRGIPPLFVSLPVFWIGIILIQVFSFRLGLVPVIGANPVQALILPVITLATPIAAPLSQVLMRSIDEVREQPFVAVVRARGASTPWLLWRNVARNALLPTLTMAGLLFGELVGGAVVTETVFARAGIGQLTAQAVANRDTPVLLAVVVISTVAFVVINLIVDLLYPVLDARLRTSGPTRGSVAAPREDAADRAVDELVDAEVGATVAAAASRGGNR